METCKSDNYRFIRNIGSYPTYEEWKPILAVVAKAITIVLILPMRNGNLGYEIAYSQDGIVLILPMRNGNVLSLYSFCPLLFVLILPMRNGNCQFSLYSFSASIYVLILPMRNGNLSWTDNNNYIYRVLILPMRNGNNKANLLK